jgi:hypothetical protein
VPLTTLRNINPEHFPNQEELMEALKWERVQARLSGEPEMVPDFWYHYMLNRYDLPGSKSMHYIQKPRQTGKSTTLIEIHQNSDINTWLIYPNHRSAEHHWRRLHLTRDLYKENVGVVTEYNLRHYLATNTRIDAVLLDEPEWMDERRLAEISAWVRSGHGGRTFFYGIGTPKA